MRRFLLLVYFLSKFDLGWGEEIALGKQLSTSPRLFHYERFLTEEECDHLISYARPHLAPSTIVDYNSSDTVSSDVRKSRGMYIPLEHNDAVIDRITRRVEMATSIPASHAEHINVTYYEAGGEFLPHFDAFNPQVPGEAVYLNWPGGQRIATFLMYLNTPEGGGETVFPRAHIAIQPRRGDAIFFYNVVPSGALDEMSFHSGSLVTKGEKWIVNYWLHEMPHH